VPEVDKFAEIQAKRERARRARRLAWGLTDEVIRDRMLAFAKELEAEADALAWDRSSMEPKIGTVQRLRSHCDDGLPN
jgi:hypothetical protein